MLHEACGLDALGAAQLFDYVRATDVALGVVPSDTDVVFERFFDEAGDQHLVVHAPFGARINRAWGLALRKRFCVRFDFELQAAANDDAIVLSIGPAQSFPLEEVFGYLTAATAEPALSQAILYVPQWGTRWRWNVTRALAVERQRGGKRVPTAAPAHARRRPPGRRLPGPGRLPGEPHRPPRLPRPPARPAVARGLPARMDGHRRPCP